MNEEIPLTLTVPEAGKKYFGLSRNGAYGPLSAASFRSSRSAGSYSSRSGR
jgi:hypothetical protein